jgi:hypothetical protein
MSDTKKPTAKLQMFPLSSAIWANRTQKGTYYSITFEKSYRDDSGKWQTTGSFAPQDLLLLSKLADLCDTKIRELRAADRQSEQPDEDAA